MECDNAPALALTALIPTDLAAFSLPLAAIVLLALITFAVVMALRLEQPWVQAWAILRAIVQLGLLTLVLGIIIERLDFVLAFLAVMIAAAAFMVTRRLRWGWHGWLRVTAIIAVAVAVPVCVVFGTGAIALEPNLVLATCGIIIGNAMTVSTLFGRTLAEHLHSMRDEIEGWLALGASPRRAAARAVRHAGSIALMPSTDQTRVTGIVVLPGVFVGAVFAGLPVYDAAVFQLVVLSSALSAGAVAVALWSGVLGAPTQLPRE